MSVLKTYSLVLGNAISDKHYTDWIGAEPCLPAELFKPRNTSELYTIKYALILYWEHYEFDMADGD